MMTVFGMCSVSVHASLTEPLIAVELRDRATREDDFETMSRHSSEIFETLDRGNRVRSGLGRPIKALASCVKVCSSTRARYIALGDFCDLRRKEKEKFQDFDFPSVEYFSVEDKKKNSDADFPLSLLK